MTRLRATPLREAAGAPRANARIIDAHYAVVSPGKRRGWRAKLMAALVTLACAALAGLALPPIMVGAYILNDALTR